MTLLARFSVNLMHDRYLASSLIIDCDHPTVLAKAKDLSAGLDNDVEIARRCFGFVRDEVYHSGDHHMDPVTLRASEVLEHRTGFCYAKAHLLAALLRANGIPAGLCYQRIACGRGFCLHGLNAVFLKDHGWYRVDARGNNEQVRCEFIPPTESLAISLTQQGEMDLPDILDEPLPSVVKVLTKYSSYLEVLRNLPDIEVVSTR
ncbi:MAG: transglutaminase-like domain-containing protein [Methanomassiliicoccus sp.]|nr:transglutaminase-like domain-containing protein [Methanomassiliicoccus sp.]